MNLLAIETATHVCSAALALDGRIRAEITMNRPRAHAEFLVPMIQDVLRYGEVSVEQLDVVAVSSGPGSYTGLRIGVSTAKGLAEAVDAALVAVPSLLGLAARVPAAAGDFVAPAFAARQNELYAALFMVDGDGKLVEVDGTRVLSTDDAGEWLRRAGGPLRLVGAGWSNLHASLRAAGLSFHYADGVVSSAGSVATIGTSKARRGETEDLVTFEPYYLKEFVARKPRASAFEKLPF